MQGRRMLYKGSGCAMVTPFTKENTLDNAALRKQAAFQLENGTDALIVCATTGEGSTMTSREKTEAIRMVVEVANGRVPVIAGVGGNDTAKVIEACRNAKEIGADGVLAVTPYYNKTTQPGLVAHFTAIADASELPVILYNVPSRTALHMKAETSAKLAGHENIVGIKEASGDIAHIAELTRLCGDTLPVYSGNDENTLPILALGGVGVISVVANVAPKMVKRLCNRFFEGELKVAREIQLQMLPLVTALFAETSPSPVKTAMAMQGHEVGAVRLPLVPMLPENEMALKECMARLALL
ncbi:MAG: 4-hydroxy-tetrahydrodipicolinate synthase [Firmicutes bacterium]|nr:4-hydroxy-tetrahydrodipicolinate synthase [Bacillota bacterium]